MHSWYCAEKWEMSVPGLGVPWVCFLYIGGLKYISSDIECAFFDLGCAFLH